MEGLSKDTNTMQGLIIDTSTEPWEQSRGFTLAEIERPTLDEAANPNDASSVIVKVKYAGVCGSDRGLWHRAAFKDQFLSALERDGKQRRIVGHEFVGEIVEAGSKVESLYADPDPQNYAKIQVGSLVSGDSHVTCGKCYQCRIGEANVCMNESILGITIDGVFAEYVKLPAKNLWAIDESRIRPEIASIMDPFGNAVHALTKVDVRGQRVAVFGAGPIGLFSILIAQKFGAAKVIAVDISAANLELAKQLGADEVIQIQPSQKTNQWEGDPAVIEKIMDITYGKGVDVSLEMAGPASSINNAIDATRRGGHVVLFGVKDGDVTIPHFPRVIVRGLTLHAIIGRQIFETWQISQRLLSQKSNGIQDKVWDVILNGGQDTVLPLSEFDPAAFEQKMNVHPKLVFNMQA
ncbi:alcohol dehydrogenase catalytic domain-containing protein [Candidatus Saccharibacteria bacterium]|nr:alcohol dehydrogenase catalytic domain-containing protein [Candidatus Saccharibacteria bacterium]